MPGNTGEQRDCNHGAVGASMRPRLDAGEYSHLALLI